MSELLQHNADALFIFPLIADGAQDFVTDYTPAAGDAKVWTDKLISTNPTALILGFDSLSELPNAGDQLDENGAGTAEGVVAFTVIVSGTVGGGDAAGFFFMRSVTGQAWSNNDQIDINGGTANIATADSTTYDLAATAGLIGEIGNGLFAAALSPTEMSCAQGEIHIVDSATKAIEDQAIQFTTFGNASALDASSGLKEIDTGTSPGATVLTLKSGSLAEPGDVVHILSSGNGVRGTRIINAFNGGTEVATFAAAWEATPTVPIIYVLFASPLGETVTVGSMETDVVDATALAASAANEIADQVWDEALSGHTTAGSAAKALADIEVDTGTTIPALLPAALVGGRMDANIGAISGDATAADNLEALMDGVLVIVVNDGSATTTAFATDGFTEASDNHFNGRLMTFISGALAFQQTDITDYDAAGGSQGSQEFSVTALTEAPANDDIAIVH